MKGKKRKDSSKSERRKKILQDIRLFVKGVNGGVLAKSTEEPERSM